MRHESREFPSFDGTTDGSSDSLNAADYSEKTFHVFGTFVATVTLEGSSDGGATWTALAAGLTAAGFLLVPESVPDFRITISGFTSGTVEARLNGFNTRVEA